MLVAILVLALGLRLPGYTESVWLDELFTSNLFCGDPVVLMKTLYSDIHPPAYFVLIHFWNALFGDAEIWLRLPPLLCGLASIVLVRSLGDLLGGRPVGLVAAFLLATSPVHIWYSQEARPYSFSVCMLLLSTLILYRLLERRRSLPWLLLYFIALSCVAFTHYYMAAFPVVFTALAIWRGGANRARIIAANAIICVLVGLYIGAKIYVSDVTTSKFYLGSFGPMAAWKLGFEWFLTGNSLTPRGSATNLGITVLVILQVLAVFVFLRGLRRLWQRPSTTPGCAGSDAAIYLLVLPVALCALTLIGLSQTYIERSALPSLPFFMIILAAGIVGWRRAIAARASLGVMGLSIAVVLFMFFAQRDKWTVYKPNPDWRSAATLLGEGLDESRELLYSDYVAPTALTYYDPRMQEVKHFDLDEGKIAKLRGAAARVFGTDGFPGEQVLAVIDGRLASFSALVRKTKEGTRLEIFDLAHNDPLAANARAATAASGMFWLLVHGLPSDRATALLGDRRITVIDEYNFRQLVLYRIQLN